MKMDICPLPVVAANAAEQEGETKQTGSVQREYQVDKISEEEALQK